MDKRLEARVARGAGGRAKPVRSRRARRLAEGTLPEQLTAELVGVGLAAAKAYGVNPRKVLRYIQTAGRLTSDAPLARRLFQDTYWLGEMAVYWADKAPYVDGDGRALVLPIVGCDPSFAGLVGRYFAADRAEEILQLAVTTGVIARAGPNKVALQDPCVMLTGQSVLLYARAVLCVRGLLSATESNALPASRRRTGGPSPDRLSCSVVPKETFSQFAEVMRPRVYDVVEYGNRWLARNAVRDRPSEPQQSGRLMGVHAYVFSDD